MIGELNRRVFLYKRIANENGRGGMEFDYDSIGNAWVAILPLNQVEINRYKQADIVTNARIIMRANPDWNLKAGDRIVAGTFTTYQIVSVLDTLNNGDYFELLAVTV